MTKNKTILVTGGGGYIGSHVCKLLKESGYIPVTFDMFDAGWEDAVKYGPYVSGDLCNAEDIQKVFKEYEIDAVMHFAGLTYVGESVQQPGRYWRNNVVGSLNLLDAMVEAGVSQLIFSSTCSTYGEHDGVTLTETIPQVPTNPYAASKLAIENMISAYGVRHGLRSVIFRYFNVAGSDPDGDIGERHVPETHLIPLVIEAALDSSKSITVFGTDYPTPDGTCVRDYVHVTDLADAHVKGLKHLESGGNNEAYNLGTGTGFSVQEVIDTVQKVTKTTINVVTGPRREGDCASLVSGGSKAETELGWKPTRSDLETMITDAWKWYQKET